MNDEYSIIPVDLILGADGIHYTAGGVVSKYGFPTADNAMFYATRPQYVNGEGLLVPHPRWSPDLN